MSRGDSDFIDLLIYFLAEEPCELASQRGKSLPERPENTPRQTPEQSEERAREIETRGGEKP